MLKAIDDNKNLVAIYDNSEIDLNIKNTVSNRAKTDLSNVENPVFKAKVIESGYQSLHLGDYISSAEDIQSIDPDFLRCDGSLIKKSDYPYIYNRFGGYGTIPIASYTKEPLDTSKLAEIGAERFSYSTSFSYDSLVFNPSKTRAISPIKVYIGGTNKEMIVLFDTLDWHIINIVDPTTIFSDTNLYIYTSVAFSECSEMLPFIFINDETILFCVRNKVTSRNDYIATLYTTSDFFTTTTSIKEMPNSSSYYHASFYGFGETSEGNQFMMAEHTYSGSSSYDRGIAWLAWNKSNVNSAAGSTRKFGETYQYLLKLGDTWLLAYGAYAGYESPYEYIQSVAALYRLSISATGITFNSFTYPASITSLDASGKMKNFLCGATYYKGKYIFGDKGSNSFITTDFKNYESYSMGGRSDYFMKQIVDFNAAEYPSSNAVFIDQRSNGKTSIKLSVAYQREADQASFAWSHQQSYLFSNYGLSNFYSMCSWIDNDKLKIIVGNTTTLDLQLLTINLMDFNVYINVPAFSDTMSSYSDNSFIKRNFEGKKYLYIKAR